MHHRRAPASKSKGVPFSCLGSTGSKASGCPKMMRHLHRGTTAKEMKEFLRGALSRLLRFMQVSNLHLYFIHFVSFRKYVTLFVLVALLLTAVVKLRRSRASLLWHRECRFFGTVSIKVIMPCFGQRKRSKGGLDRSRIKLILNIPGYNTEPTPIWTCGPALS